MLNNKKGIAMLVAISLMLMLLILGGAAVILSTSHGRTSIHQIQRARAYATAEAAMQHVLWQLRTNQPAPGTLPASFNVNGIDDSDILIIEGAKK